ncbi:MAG TPA: PIN domain-containing protein [Solirubrobacterales bacterium]|nr:PIN domain-containing protein [Solirubrobacterales bacterium]
MTLIDTHVALWLYAGLTERLPDRVRALLAAGGQARISPLAALELAYMHEIGRARDSAPTMLAALRQSIGLEVENVSLSGLVDAAMTLSWTRDPFDRLISAHAIVADAPLVTADRTILANLPLATWD